MRKTIILVVGLALIFLANVSPARADGFSFTGSFTADDNVQLFTFTVGAPSTVTLRTWSYAGGINFAGNTIAEGGFDPILALFDSTGALINQNDDGGSNVPADSQTGAQFDTFLKSPLAAGTYTVSVMEYDNFATGPNLSNGFGRQGSGNFTIGNNPNCPLGGFVDVTRSCRTGNWAFDILNVNSATVQGVPEPSSLFLLGSGLVSLLGFTRRRLAA